MTLTITATYRQPEALHNVFDELINRGIPREQIFRHHEAAQVKVIIPAASEPEVNEVLIRHRPTRFSGSSGRTAGAFADTFF